MNEQTTEFILPNGWATANLDELFVFIGGGTPDKTNSSYWNGNICWASVKDIKSKNLYSTEDKITIDGLKNSSAQLANIDDLILVTRIAPGQVSIAKVKTAINQDLKIVKYFGGLTPEFVYYLFKSIAEEFINRSSGTTVKGIKITDLSRIQIALPPLKEQHRITNKIEELFSVLDSGIANLKQAQQQLKVYRQALLKIAFEGKLTRKEIKLDDLPEGWRWVKLNEICDIAGGVTKGRDFKGKDTIQLPYLRVANVQDGFLDLREVKTIEVLPTDKEKYKLEYGDILYTEGGDKDKLGRGTIWKNEIENCIHQNHIFRARPSSKEVDPKYIAYFSQTKYAKDYFFKRAKQTTNLASINITVLSNLPIPLCPPDEQIKIVQEIESRLSVCDYLEQTTIKNLQKAEVLRRSILNTAFTGKLVEQDMHDEPASELLKRLQVEIANHYEAERLTKRTSTELNIMKKTLIDTLRENFKEDAFTYEEMRSKVTLSYSDLKTQLFELLNNENYLETEFDKTKEKILFKVKK